MRPQNWLAVVSAITLGRRSGEPFICRKKSLRGVRQKKSVRNAALLRSTLEHAFAGMYSRKSGPQRRRVKRFFPANRLKPTPGLEPGTPSYELWAAVASCHRQSLRAA